MNYVEWLWDAVFHKVYGGDAVMMATFGWALFLAPVLVVVCGYTVVRGATDAFKKPTAAPTATIQD